MHKNAKCRDSQNSPTKSIERCLNHIKINWKVFINIFVQLSFSSNTERNGGQPSGSNLFCTEFQTGWQKVQQSPNEVDTSLVKSQLIYFAQSKSALGDKTVRFKVSFEKSGAKINENEITAANETLWGKLGAFITK